MVFESQGVERKEIAIMRVLSDSAEPVGARVIAHRLKEHGFELGERAVRYHLKLMDERGLTYLAGRRDGRVLTDMASLLKENPRHHGPIRDGECSGCHDSHASTRLYLLTAEYPEYFYVPFDTKAYALCFECHIENLAVAEQGIGVSEFRDKERSLHFVHVNKEWRGRTCRACHDVHASARPFHMREAVPFGPGGSGASG